MKCALVMVPPGGGEADYQLAFDLASPPRVGEFITIAREDAEKFGYECFYVRSVWWDLKYPNSALYATSEDHPIGKAETVLVECEFARGPHMTEEHARACDVYEQRGYAIKEFDNTMY